MTLREGLYVHVYHGCNMCIAKLELHPVKHLITNASHDDYRLKSWC